MFRLLAMLGSRKVQRNDAHRISTALRVRNGDKVRARRHEDVRIGMEICKHSAASRYLSYLSWYGACTNIKRNSLSLGSDMLSRIRTGEVECRTTEDVDVFDDWH